MRTQAVLRLVIGWAVMVSGCAKTLASASAGQVGCPPSEVEISDSKTRFSSRTWTAECRGRRYFCSAVTGGESVQVSCAPENGDAATAYSRTPNTGHATTAPKRARSKVQRDYDETSQNYSVKASFRLRAGGDLLMVGSPQSHPGVIQIAYEAAYTVIHRCEGLEVLVNAKPHAATDLRPALGGPGARKRLVGTTETSWYAGLQNSFPEFILRACGQDNPLDEAQLADLKKFLAIYSELASSGDPEAVREPAGGEEEPAGGEG